MLPRSKLKAAAEIFGDAADQKRRLHACMIENPRKHGCSSGLAVCTSDHENFFSTQEFIVKNLRQRAERDALIKHIFEFYVATRDRIADHNQVGPRCQIFLGKRL